MALLNSKGTSLVKLGFKISSVKCLLYNDIQRYDLKSEMLYKHLWRHDTCYKEHRGWGQAAGRALSVEVSECFSMGYQLHLHNLLKYTCNF